jgi:uncharacterized protein (DUF1684 family)
LNSLIENSLTFSSKFLRMKFLKLLVILILLSACNSNKSEFTIDANYISEIDTFFDEKMKERQEDYLQLVALYRLNEGINSFGKDESNILVLNIDTLPETIGNILMNQDSLSFNAAENILIKTKEDSMVTNMPLKLNEYESSIKLYHNQLSWQIITRSKQHYLRVWNTQNPAIKDFKGFQKFDLNNSFIYDADFTYYEKEKSEIVKAEVDGKRSVNFIGKVTFNHNNETYSLEVGNDGFTMVGDDTTGEATYGGGRYMYIQLPETNGKTVIDFNKLYNPPCAFSEFTTCLYPPRQNHLPFAILAGEKIVQNN